jgi:hypothetical protein
LVPETALGLPDRFLVYFLLAFDLLFEIIASSSSSDWEDESFSDDWYRSKSLFAGNLSELTVA